MGFKRERDRKAYHRTYYERNKVKASKQARRYRRLNKDRIRMRNQRWRKKNRSRLLKKHHRYYKENKSSFDIYRKKNATVILERARRYYKKNRDKILEKKRRYDQKNRTKQKRYNKAYVERTRAKRRAQGQARKLRVLKAYGRVCKCCRESNIGFLTIDHIDGKGTAHRRRLKGGWGSFYQWLIKHKFPSGYQVLCYNCNCGRSHTPDLRCPHLRPLLKPEKITKNPRTKE